MAPDFTRVKLAYHGATEAAVTHLMDQLRQNPPASWTDPRDVINTVAVHVLASLDTLDQVRPTINDPDTDVAYNHAADSVHRAFANVEETAETLGVEIQPGRNSDPLRSLTTHLIAECHKITAMSETAIAATDPAEKLALLIAIREADQDFTLAIDDLREQNGLQPMHEIPQGPGPEGDALIMQVFRDSMPAPAADIAVEAHQARWNSIPLRREIMKATTIPDPTFLLNIHKPPVSDVLRNFREGHRSVELSLLLPVFPEFIPDEEPHGLVLLIYEHGLDIVCQTHVDPYPATMTNSSIQFHCDRMLKWAENCQHKETERAHAPMIRAAAQYLQDTVRTRRDPTSWNEGHELQKPA